MEFKPVALDLFVTFLSFFMMLIFTNILTVIVAFLPFVYWLPKIKKEQVDIDYSGSWFKWAKDWLKNLLKKN